MRRCDVSGAAGEGYCLRREGHAAPLHLRRLVLGEQRRPRSSNGVRKPRASRRGSRLTPSVGAIFGATLKSVLDYSGVQPSKRDLIEALRHAARFLAPTRAAVENCPGDDRPHLANGLMAHRVASAQRRRLEESREPEGARTYLGRNGLKDIAVGATAAVLASHHVMSVRRSADAPALLASVSDALERIGKLLSNWPVSADCDDDWHTASLRAEKRALERARASGVAAAREALARRLDHAGELQLHLEWMRSAAWPRGVRCDAQTARRS